MSNRQPQSERVQRPDRREDTMNSISAHPGGFQARKRPLKTPPIRISCPPELPPLECALFGRTAGESPARAMPTGSPSPAWANRLTYRDTGNARPRKIAAWLRSTGPAEGRSRRRHDAQHAAEPGRRLRHPARRHDVVVNVNPLYTPRELEHQLRDSRRARRSSCWELRAHGRAGAAPTPPCATSSSPRSAKCSAPKGLIAESRRPRRSRSWCRPGPSRSTRPSGRCWSEGAARRSAPGRSPGNDIAFLQYTGGTTGVAKGAMLTHRNICRQQARSCRVWLQIRLRQRSSGRKS